MALGVRDERAHPQGRRPSLSKRCSVFSQMPNAPAAAPAATLGSSQSSSSLSSLSSLTTPSSDHVSMIPMPDTEPVQDDDPVLLAVAGRLSRRWRRVCDIITRLDGVRARRVAAMRACYALHMRLQGAYVAAGAGVALTDIAPIESWVRLHELYQELRELSRAEIAYVYSTDIL